MVGKKMQLQAMAEEKQQKDTKEEERKKKKKGRKNTCTIHNVLLPAAQ